jgi:AbiJ N-terminal domain 4
MKSFSQRKGLKPVPEVAQIGSMSEELRNSLWNVLDSEIWSVTGFLYKHHGKGKIEEFSRVLWSHYFKTPADSRDKASFQGRERQILSEIREYFFGCEWNEVYDFLEFAVPYLAGVKRALPELVNKILERELSGYKFIDGVIVDITDAQECALLAEALADTRFSPVTGHLERALQLLADRKQPDYRNSIKESISAVEAMARVVSSSPKATLGDALKVLEKNGHIHPALKEGFSKLYGYTSDESGIRHAMMDDGNTIDQSDAKYFLLSCTSFISYLKANLA